MMEKNKLLITEALDEKALLSKRIHSKIESANLVDFMKHNENKVCVTMESKIFRIVFDEWFLKEFLNRYSDILKSGKKVLWWLDRPLVYLSAALQAIS